MITVEYNKKLPNRDNYFNIYVQFPCSVDLGKKLPENGIVSAPSVDVQ